MFGKLEDNVLIGVAAGLGAAMLAPILLPMATRVARPALKGAIRTGLLMYEAGRETVAEVREMAEDMTAEVQAEMRTQGAPATRRTATKKAG